MTKRIWKAGLYARLSKEDGHSESLSIGHQLARLRQYVAQEEDLVEEAVYIDDGISGVHTNRPAFQQMLSDAKAGRIDCIMVKDLSRLSRNYIEAGQYLEEWFIKRQIRFLSLELPFYDSLQEPWGMQSILIPLQNLINDDFCRQTSLKIRSVLQTKQRQGQFTGAFAPYGYRKSAEDHHVLEVDEAAAEVVRWIFHGYVVEQRSMGQLANSLNDAGIASPSAYKRQAGLAFFSPAASQAEGKWTEETIRQILHHPVYRGAMVQGKTRRKSYKVKSQMRLPPDQWIWVDHTHPPLVEKTIFDQAQQRRKSQASFSQRKGHLLSGLVFCGQCGRRMTTKSARGKGYFVCPNQRKGTCGGQTVAEAFLEQAILAFLGPLPLGEEVAFPAKEREVCLLDTLYLEYLTGALDQETYLRLKTRLEKEEHTPCLPEQNPLQQERFWLMQAVERIVVGEERVEVYLRFRQSAGAQSVSSQLV